jgi:hypothetical protein
MDPVFTVFPLHAMVYVALLSLKFPCVSREKLYGPVPTFVKVTVLLDAKTYGPPEPTDVPDALDKFQEVSSRNPVPDMVIVILEPLPPDPVPVPAVTVPFSVVGCPGQTTASGPAFTIGLLHGGVGQDTI